MSTPFAGPPAPPAFASARFIRRLVAGIVILDCLVILMVGLSIYRGYRQELRATETTTRNLALLLERDLVSQFDRIDLALLTIEEECERLEAAGDLAAGGLDQFIARHFSRQVGLRYLRVANVGGDVTHGTEITETVPVNISDREYFKRLRDQPELGLVISEPLLGLASHEWVIALARRIDQPSGEFAGIVFATITLAQFQKQFAAVDLGPHGVVSLRALDLSTVARYPAPETAGITAGNKTVSPEWRELVKTEPNSGTYSAVSPDGLRRTISYHRVGQYPLFVNIGLFPPDYLSSWWRQTAVTGILLGVFLVATLLFSRLIARAWSRREADSRRMVELSQLALQHSEDHLRLALDAAGMGVWASNPITGVMTADAQAKRLHGLPADAPLDHEFGIAAVHPDDRDLVRADLQRAIEAREPFDLLIRTVHPDGSLHWLSSRGRCIPGQSSNLGGMIGVVQDVTQTKQAEAVLRASEDRYRVFFENAAVGAVEVAAASARFLKVNERFCQFLGYSADELLQLSPLDVTPPDDRETQRPMLADFLSGKSSNFRVEMRFVRKNGLIVWGQVAASLICDAAGQPLRAVGIIADITERKQAEAELHRHHVLLSTVIDSLPVGLWVFDQAGNLAFCNPAARAIWGDLRTTGLDRLESYQGWRRRDGRPVAPADWAGARAFRDGIVTLREPIDIVGADGVRRTILDSALPLRDANGQIAGAVAINEDVTEQLATENALKLAKAQAEAANNAKTRFLASVSHDLRQPLQAQRFLLFNLSQQSKSAAQVKACAQMEKTLDATESMLSRLMDFAALESGNVPVKYEIFRLDQFILDLVVESSEDAARKQIEFRRRLPLCWTESDPVLLGRILRNLITNALRYTEQGGVLVGIRRRSGRLRIEVWDTGKGIPADQQQIIFEEFRQLENPERNRTKGHGLGLAIVAKTSELLGLRLSLRSKVGRGSVFAIEVPAAEPPQPAINLGRDDTIAPIRTTTILLIEDDFLQAEALQAVFTAFDYRVVVAHDATEAIAALTNQPDIIVSDYRLPENQNGVAVVTALRRASGRSLPAIIVTGDTQANIALEVALAGCEIVHKPCTPSVLFQALTRLTLPAVAEVS